MRIPEADISSPKLSDANRIVIEQTIARRGRVGLLKLDLALFHSFPVATGWNAFFTALKDQTTVPKILCEIAICRVALLLGADYQWQGHVASLRECEDMNDAKFETIKTRNPLSRGELSDLEWAVLKYADSVTLTGKVEDEVFHQMQELGMSHQAMVETTAVIAAYNCVGRFLLALEVE